MRKYEGAVSSANADELCEGRPSNQERTSRQLGQLHRRSANRRAIAWAVRSDRYRVSAITFDRTDRSDSAKRQVFRENGPARHRTTAEHNCMSDAMDWLAYGAGVLSLGLALGTPLWH